MNGTPDPDLADVIKFSKIEIKRLTNRLGQAPIASAAEPEPVQRPAELDRLRPEESSAGRKRIGIGANTEEIK